MNDKEMKREAKKLMDEFDDLTYLIYALTLAYLISDDDGQEKTKYALFFSLMLDGFLEAAYKTGKYDWIIYDEELDSYFMTGEAERELFQETIDEYEEDYFWEELIHRLALRDMEKEHSAEELKKMDREGYFKHLSKYKTLYEDEFAKNGLYNLVIE